MDNFNWLNAIERGLWTGVQAPAGMAIVDQVIADTNIPALSYWVAAGATVALSILKTLSQDRLMYLAERRRVRKGGDM